MSYINFNHVTKDYGEGKGLFDVDFHINKGESFGIVGINGAGKTTIIRHLMGFVTPNSGSIEIDKKDAFKDAKEIKKLVAYIPGEINFPQVKTGDDFLKQQAGFWNVENLDHVYSIVNLLGLDTKATLKRMSKGMKQKTAISTAFLPDNDILIFDEPTTGLDPLMRNVFTNLVEKEKKKGKTIVMSSHMFDELEECCDRVAMIKDGKLLRIVDVKKEIKNNSIKKYKVEFFDSENLQKFKKEKIDVVSVREKFNQVIVNVEDKNINKFVYMLSYYDVKFIKEIKPSLEDLFLKTYQLSEENDKKIKKIEEKGEVRNVQ